MGKGQTANFCDSGVISCPIVHQISRFEIRCLMSYGLFMHEVSKIRVELKGKIHIWLNCGTIFTIPGEKNLNDKANDPKRISLNATQNVQKPNKCGILSMFFFFFFFI